MSRSAINPTPWKWANNDRKTHKFITRKATRTFQSNVVRSVVHARLWLQSWSVHTHNGTLAPVAIIVKPTGTPRETHTHLRTLLSSRPKQTNSRTTLFFAPCSHEPRTISCEAIKSVAIRTYRTNSRTELPITVPVPHPNHPSIARKIDFSHIFVWKIAVPH